MLARPLAKEAFLSEPGRTGEEDPEAGLREGCRRGERTAFEELYRAHGPRMKSIAMNLLRDVSDAEDAVQETFLKVYRSSGGFQGESRLSTWIYRILINSCYDAIRRRRRRREGRAPEENRRTLPETPGAASDSGLRLALEDSLARIPDRPRTVFLLAAVEGFTHREIGDILNISEGASRILLFEARRKLQALLAPAERRRALA